MKGKFILLSILVASAIAFRAAKFTGTQCACAELPTQAECNLAVGRCAWGSSCSAVTSDCASLTTQAPCDAVDACGWNGTVCAAFTNCTSYVVTNSSECYQKSAKCSPPNGVAANFTGANTTCAEQTITNCTTITDLTVCAAYGCNNTGSTCTQGTCAGLAGTAASCVSVGSLALNNLNLCALVNNTCTDANVTTGLTSTNCADATDVTYAWNNGACTACTGSSSSASLLAFLGFAATILL